MDTKSETNVESGYETKRSIDVKKLCRLPLHPKATRKGLINALDMAAPLRDLLRDHLAIDVVGWSTSEHKTTLQHKQQLLAKEDTIREAEWTLMEQHATFLCKKDSLLSTIPARPKLCDFDIPEEFIKKYNLIKMSSLAPHIHVNEESCLLEPDSEDPCEHLHSMRERIEVKESNKIKSEMETKKLCEKKLGHYYSKNKRAIFKVIPKQVIFKNYEVGITYSVKVKVQNVGQNSFMLKVTPPECRTFEVSWDNKHHLLVPGLIIVFNVSFCCNYKEDYYDRLLVTSETGDSITIPIMAVQATPCLLCTCYNKYTMSTAQELLKSSIDCGRCYVGAISVVKTPIHNPCAVAKFFILSELSWHLDKIKDMTKENILIQEPFYIQPCHFRLGERKKKNLKVVFSPHNEGSHIIQVLVLCENITVRAIDILGEAIMFDPCLFTIQDLEKTYRVTIDGADSTEHYLDLGRLLSNSSTKKFLYVVNKSLVETKFSWEVSRSEIADVGFLSSENIEISPAVGSLCPQTPMEFTITCHSHDLPVGKYVIIFSIFMEDIPKAALNKKEIILYPESISESMVRICSGKIEAFLNIESPNVCLWPNFLHFSNELHTSNYKKVFMTNYENEWLTIRWQLPFWKSLCVHPSKRVLPPFSSSYVYIVLKTECVGRFFATLSAYFEQCTSTFELLCECETHLSLIPDVSGIKDIGILRKGENKTGNLYASCPTPQKVALDINHISLRYNSGDRGYFEECDNCWLLQCPTSLKPDKLSRLIIKMRTEEEHITIDMIEWSFCGVKRYTSILSDVQELTVTLLPAELTLTQPLVRGVDVSLPLMIKNHKRLMTAFTWNGYFGHSTGSCRINATPQQAVLLPASQAEITITVHPLVECYIDDLYFHFSIEHLDKPLLGSIKGYVKDTTVEISWINNSREICFKWPQEECNSAHRQYPSLETLISQVSFNKQCSVCYSEQFTHSSSNSVSWEEMVEKGIMDFKDSDVSSVPYSNWPYIGGKYYGADFTDERLQRDFETPWIEESLTDRLKGIPQEDRDLFLTCYSQNAMTFTIDAFKVYSQKLLITNLSPITVKYRIKTNQFHSEKHLPFLDVFRLAEMIFHDEGLGYKNFSPALDMLKWTLKNRKDVGLAVRVKKKRGTIAANGFVAVTVSVFAVLWGTYLDDLTIYINDHPPFHVPLFVKCEHSPIFFTFAPQSIAPLLRFPTIGQNKIWSKTVYLENKSLLPLKVVWTVYHLSTEEEWDHNYCLSSLAGSQSFSLAIELHPTNRKHFCNLKLLDYVGYQLSLFYTVEPGIVYLPPGSKAPIEITADSRMCLRDISHSLVNMAATALGVVYIDHVDKKNEDYYCCYRPDGYDMKPITLKMETMVEMLSFRVVNCAKKHTIFEVCTSKIFNSTKAEHVMNKTFLIKNYSQSAAFILVEVEEPFAVLAIKHFHGLEKDLHREFTLNSSETVEVEVTLKLSKKILTRRSESKASLIETKFPIISDLKFGPEDGVPNCLKLELHLLKPVFIFTEEKVNFGQTCIRMTKYKDIKVYVRNGNQPFKVRIEGNIFNVIPSLGLIREGMPTLLSIAFTPQECKRYCNVIEFITSTPGSIPTLFVEGSGSLDYKIYS